MAKKNPPSGDRKDRKSKPVPLSRDDIKYYQPAKPISEWTYEYVYERELKFQLSNVQPGDEVGMRRARQTAERVASGLFSIVYEDPE